MPAKSYAPYSDTDEFCYLEGESGLLYPGVRIENISFPLTISAVHGAIFSCLGNSDRPKAVIQQEPYSELLDYWIHSFDLQIKDKLPGNPRFFSPLLPQPVSFEQELHSYTAKSVTIHSRFPVSALLVTPSGTVPGVNVEVTAWSQGLCAERLAVFRAVSAGIRDFEQLHVYAPKGDFASPCGACRQILSEWMPGKPVILHHGDGTLSKHITSHLLPFGFISNSLSD